MSRTGIETLSFDTVTNFHRQAIGGSFAAEAVTLIVRLTTTDTEDTVSERYGSLTWYVADSLDDGDWSMLEDTAGDYDGFLGWRVTGSSSTSYFSLRQTRRFVVPFGPRLAVAVSPSPADGRAPLRGVTAKIFWTAPE